MKDQVRGTAEENKGQVTGNRGEEMKGRARQIVGNVKHDMRDFKGDVTSKSTGNSKPTSEQRNWTRLYVANAERFGFEIGRGPGI
jgi:uncharacterized protein YjbJ (UPF0337 family)